MIRGRVLELDGRSLAIQTDFAAEPIEIDWAAVRALTTHDVYDVRLKRGETLRGRLVSPEEGLGTDEEEAEDGAPLPAPVPDPDAPAQLTIATSAGIFSVAALDVRGIDPPGGLTLRLEAGYAFAEGEDQHAHAVYGRAGGRWLTDKSYVAVDLLGAATPRGERDRDRRTMVAEGLLTRRLGGPYLLQVSADGLSDARRDIAWRLAVGGGLGYRLDVGDDAILLAEAGPVYVRERREHQADREVRREDVAVRLGVRAELPDLHRAVGLESRAFVLVGTERSSDLRARVLAGPRIRLGRGFDLTARAVWEYDGAPAPRAGKHDVSFEGGFGWSF